MGMPVRLCALELKGAKFDLDANPFLATLNVSLRLLSQVRAQFGSHVGLMY